MRSAVLEWMDVWIFMAVKQEATATCYPLKPPQEDEEEFEEATVHLAVVLSGLDGIFLIKRSSQKW